MALYRCLSVDCVTDLFIPGEVYSGHGNKIFDEDQHCHAFLSPYGAKDSDPLIVFMGEDKGQDFFARFEKL